MREILPRAYGGWELMTSVSGTAGLVIEHIDAGHFSSSDGSLPGDLSFKVNGRGAVSIATVTQGTVWADRGPVTECYQPGEVFVASFPQADFVCRTRDARIHALTMPALAAGPGRRRGPGRPRLAAAVPVPASGQPGAAGPVERHRSLCR